MSKNVTIDLSELKNFSKKVDNISGKRNVQMQDILTDRFISANTKFSNLDNFMSSCGIHTEEDFTNFPDKELDKFVQANTNFSSWKDMLTSASAEYYKNQLGL